MGDVFTLDRETIDKYANITDAQRKLRPSSEFMAEVIDRYMHGTNFKGIKLPFKQFDNLFRLRPQEITVLAGINGAGKSLLASSMMLHAMDQGYKCMSISLEMSPVSQVARMVRQASLTKQPDMDTCLAFQRWSHDKMFFYDQYGTVDPRTLMSVIRYGVERYGVDLVLVDSLMTLSLASDDYNGQKGVVSALANAARGLDTHVILVAHARKGNSINDRLDKWSVAGSADITNRADNVIILGRLYDHDGAQAYLSVAKARHFDGAELDIDLKFDLPTLTYYYGEDLPHTIGLDDSVTPHDGVTGDLNQAGLGVKRDKRGD